jgi:pimeloyl-ACP methyl ester carboxylesterase
MARVVLIHGSSSGAWVWEPLVGDLRASGHIAEAIDLPGAGEDKTPPGDVSLDAYVQRICETLAAGPRAVLVGASMGGIAITQASARAPEHVAALVYIAAFAPAHGESLQDLVSLPEAATDGVQANMVVEGNVGMVPAEAAREVVYNECSPEVVAWAVARRRPQPLRPFGDKVDLDGIKPLPKAYVLCTHDRAIPPPLQRLMAARAGCDPVIELDADHSPWLSRRDELMLQLQPFLAAH